MLWSGSRQASPEVVQRKLDGSDLRVNAQKKQGATGITTVAPYVAGQWGRGNNRLPG
jgi:hypothetical protein